MNFECIYAIIAIIQKVCSSFDHLFDYLDCTVKESHID
jgi:hypothetical protein